jgi:filamentous hemagglutinin family protein
MTQNLHGWQVRVINSMALAGAIALSSMPVLAQLNLTPDTQPGRSLGTTIQPRSPVVDVVTGGTASNNGANLFHSFAEFNVNSGRSVLFNNPPGVRNILSRVTGSDRSDILGTLGVEGPANLFLLNPNGILFGSGASLNVSGAFVATTATEIQFGGQGRFSALPVAGEALTLLTIDPSALLFNQLAQPRPSIVLTGTATNQVSLFNPTQSLLLVGGDVNLTQATLGAAGGRVELGAIADTATVNLERNAAGGDLRLDFPQTATRGDISLTQQSTVDVAAGGGGYISLFGNTITLSGGSRLVAGIASNQGATGSQAGDIRIDGTGAIRILGDPARSSSSLASIVENNVAGTGVGRGGNIAIDGASVELNGFATQVRTNILSQRSECTPSTCNAGNITVQARRLDILNPDAVNSGGSGFQANTRGIGNAGTIELIINGPITINNSGRVQTQVANVSNESPIVRGDGGTITIVGQSLTLDDLARIEANSSGRGNAGNINIRVQGAIALSQGSFITTEIGNNLNQPDVIVQGGDISLTAQTIAVSDRNTIIQANTSTSGPGGDITLNAPTITVSDRGAIRANTSRAGEGGTITLSAQTVAVTNRGAISANTSRDGVGGDIQITAPQSVLVSENGNISVAAESGTTERGRGGNIVITTDWMRVENNANVSAATTGRAQGGSITINTDQLEIVEGGRVLASTQRSGNGGTITVNAAGGRVLVAGRRNDDNSELSADTANRSTGRGGNIVITADLLQVQGRGEVSAINGGEKGEGSITANVNRLELTQGGRLIARTDGSGDAGDITVNLNGGSILLSGRTNDETLRTAGFLVNTRARGNAGSIRINNAGQIVIENDASITGAAGSDIRDPINVPLTGRGGSVTITADQIQLQRGGAIIVNSEGIDSAGNLDITAPIIRLDDRARIEAGTIGSSGGNIILQGITSLQVNNSQIAASTIDGTGGSLDIRAPDGSILLNGADGLSVEATGRGSAGNLTVVARDVTVRNGARIAASNVSSTSTSTSDVGNIRLNDLDTLVVTDNGQISASTQTGRAGSLSISASRAVRLDRGGELTVEATGGGSAGSLRVVTDQFTAQNNSQVTVSSTGSGTAGTLAIAAQSVFLNNRTQFTAETAAGRGGNIQLQIDNSLRLQNNSSISASTESGRGGNLTVNDGGDRINSVQLTSGSQLSASANSGIAGELIVNTQQLLLDDRANRSDPARIVASTVSGSGGDIRLTGLETLQINNGRISASTQTGRAGSLSVNASDTVAINGGGLLVEATGNGGTAGNLLVSARRLAVQDSGQVSVRSQQGQAGNLTVQADAIALSRGTLTAATAASGEGGGANIRLLGLRQLTMRDRSLISAEATNGANGGNISIDAAGGFIVAVPEENSDIVANATDRGTGGEINITTQGIFGLVPITGALAPISEINASSEFGINGEVIINTPDVDPSRGLIELPTDITDASRLIAQGCSGRGRAIANRQQSEFVVTGRGGLPTSPEEPLNPTAIVTPWVALDSSTIPTASNSPDALMANSMTTGSMVEAQGWTVGRDGEVVLTAYAPDITLARPGFIPAACQ